MHCEISGNKIDNNELSGDLIVGQKFDKEKMGKTLIRLIILSMFSFGFINHISLESVSEKQDEVFKEFLYSFKQDI